ncbi:MAG: hypothetical protein KQH83_11465 [Actinobacteria bacterium]|nr:hypothetical protein [Actinomycetota bacterium]
MSTEHPSLRETVRHFNPAWFAAVMGTAVVPLAVSFMASGFARPVSAVFMVVSAAMFVALLVPWTTRFLTDRDAVAKDLDHPVAANFFPTMPIALVLLALDLLKYPDLLLSAPASREAAWVLWLAGSAGIYVFGFVVLARIFRHPDITLQHANFGFYIPPVSKLLIPVAGLELAAVFPGRFEAAFVLSMVSLGVGFFLFLFVGATVYQRHILEPLPMSRFAATSFIAAAPTAIVAVVLFKLQALAGHGMPLDWDPGVIRALAGLGIVVSWGFALWAFVMAVIVIAGYLLGSDLPYALSWWAFVFPSGALAVSSGVAWKATGFASIHWAYRASVWFLFAVWALVAVRTVHGVATRRLFAPGH